MTTMDSTSIDINSDPTFSALTASVKEEIERFKKADAEYTAAAGDRDAQIRAFKASDDEQVVKYRDAIKVLTEKLNAYAQESVKVNDVSDEEKEKLVKARNEARKSARDVIKVVSDSAALFERQKGLPYKEAFAKWLEEYGDPTKSRAVSSGTMLPKVPVYISVEIPAHDGVEAQRTDFANFTLFSQWRGISTADAQAETARAAGLAPEALAKFSEPVTYEVDHKGVTATVRVSPKETKPRGRKPKAEQGEAGPLPDQG